MRFLLLTLAFAVSCMAYAKPDHPPGGPRHAPYTVQLLPGTGADDGTVIDVLVVLSNQAASYAYLAQQAVDDTNAVFAASGITTRLHLTAVAQISYNEAGFNDALNVLATDPNVGALRENYHADLVSMLVIDGTYCGLGYIGPSPSYAFSVVNVGCAVGNHSFAHELGHNFGALHDPYVDPSTYPYAYGHGFVSPYGFRDVMAYADAYADACGGCVRVGQFSSATVLYQGLPIGDATTSDVTRVINQNAYTVANFRTATVVVQPPPPPPSPPPPCKLRGKSGKCT